MSERKSIDEILSKYSRKISQNISSEENTGNVSKEYTTFKKDMVPRLSRYENFVKAFSFLKLSVSGKDRGKMQRFLNISHLDVSPEEVAAASFMGGFLTFFIGVLIAVGLFFLQNREFTSQNLIFVILI